MTELRKHWITKKEREFFHREGYLTVPNALTIQEVDRLADAVDRHAPKGHQGFYNRMDIVGLDDAFVDLVDHPPVFAKICGLLGWNIWVNHSNFNVRPPTAPEAGPYPYIWHRDGGSVNFDLQAEPPLMNIKAAFFLSDASKPGRGQTWIIPRKWSEKVKLRQLDSRELPPKAAVQLLPEAGTAILFQNRCFHSQGSPNVSNITRKTVFLQWAYRWLFPADGMTTKHLHSRVSDPVRRQLLGLLPKKKKGFSERYYPNEADVPLQARLIDEIGLDLLDEIGPETIRGIARYLRFHGISSVFE